MTFAKLSLRPIYFFFALIFAQRARCAAAIRLRPAADILRRPLPMTLSIDTVLPPPSSFMTCSIRAMSFRISAMMLSLLNVCSLSLDANEEDSMYSSLSEGDYPAFSFYEQGVQHAIRLEKV